MAKKTTKAAPADGASTAANLQAAWPFPIHKKEKKGGRDEQEIVDPAVEREDFQQDFDAHADATHPPAVERIRVDAIDLYTDPAKNQVQRLALEQLLESPFNPRTRYDEKALNELAETVRDVGVMQALLVRPIEIPSGWSITRGGETLQPYEIVFGHRRYRAARIAGRADVPVIIRDLTNAQSAQLQAIENVQREDLDPLEEARGYAHYLQVHGVNKDQLAKEVGLSRSHVYARLKLLTAVPAVHEALRSGEIFEENALHIARIPHAKLQEKALASLRSNQMDLEDGGKRSVRRIRDFLRERFTLKLSEAMFDPKDAQLLEGCGSCDECPKRSGNAPEFDDLAASTDTDWQHKLEAGPDLCTDPDCFDAKKKAHLAAKAEVLKAKGKTVIEGSKARAAIGADGKVKGAYVALKDVREALAKAKKNGTPVATVVIQNPRDGKPVEAVKVEDLKTVGVKVKAPRTDRDKWEQQQRKREEERKRAEQRGAVNTKVNTTILAAVRQACAGKPPSTLALQHVVTAAYRGVDWQEQKLIAQLHDCKSPEALLKKIGQLAPDRLATLLLDCALIDNVVDDGYDRHKPTALLAIANECGVDVAAIRKEVTATAADTRTRAEAQEEEAEA